jgi:hypothetical protein
MTNITALANYATSHWLNSSSPLLDYANAMVASQKTSISTLESGWQQHLDGTTSVPPLAPARLTGSLWLIGGRPTATTTAAPMRKPPRTSSRRCPRLCPIPPMACWDTCFGQLAAREMALVVRIHPILAKAASELERPASRFQYRCRLCARTDMELLLASDASHRPIVQAACSGGRHGPGAM